MSYYIVIREKRESDTPVLNEIVKNGYLSTVNNSWINALFQEITFQLIILLAALLFICFGVPLYYSIVSVPIVLISLYCIIYSTIFMKSAQLIYEKRPLKCWIAESYEPYFFMKTPESCWYKIIEETDLVKEGIDQNGFQRKMIGTISVGQHSRRDDWAWLFRLVVDKRYRRKGVGLKLINTVQDWCRTNQFNAIELAIGECQDGCRELFNKAGFEVEQFYHKQLLGRLITLQMFQLRCEVRSTF
ncbi:unnamed protein product [Psylliodes chrysocephalus]|uniref:N-acetyltransferase domain-containing protein n=1 Tax=Psylliodes chrysocephalus TaxID=3402493 RepID=A0A9P0DA81_9CUCU|nr:unnamed protein product [Psylliodes chrysocephala]